MTSAPIHSTVVVLGASAGGIESLIRVVRGFAPSFNAAVLVVVHMPPHFESQLPHILGRAGPLPACHPHNGQRIEAAHIYVAPPGYDLTLEAGSAVLKQGASENRYRPSIDGLFQSAAYDHGQSAIGVILSGLMDDGARGLYSIKRAGGITVVQHLSDARYADMPENAISEVQADFVSPSGQIGPLLSRLTAQKALLRSTQLHFLSKWRGGAEGISASRGALPHDVWDLRDLQPFTCSECQPVLMELNGIQLSRFALAEDDLMQAGLNSLERGVMLLQHLQRHTEDRGELNRAAVVRRKVLELEARCNQIRCAIALRPSAGSEAFPDLDRSQKSAPKVYAWLEAAHENRFTPGDSSEAHCERDLPGDWVPAEEPEPAFETQTAFE
jgi:two-component system chemotaxis response regulator CheB